jgi:Fe-S cluster assembly iron-binding protein IscA
MLVQTFTNGFSVVVTNRGWFYADAKNKFDEEVNEQGVRILIDPGALMHVIGTRMDFVEDRLK